VNLVTSAILAREFIMTLRNSVLESSVKLRCCGNLRPDGGHKNGEHADNATNVVIVTMITSQNAAVESSMWLLEANVKGAKSPMIFLGKISRRT
jgi:hypothetical protein